MKNTSSAISRQLLGLPGTLGYVSPRALRRSQRAPGTLGSVLGNPTAGPHGILPLAVAAQVSRLRNYRNY